MIWRFADSIYTSNVGPFTVTVEHHKLGCHVMIDCEGKRVHGEFMATARRTDSIRMGQEQAEKILAEWLAQGVRDLVAR